MIKLVETFKDFIDTASISQGSQAWTIYGSNPKSPLIKDTKHFISKYLQWLNKSLIDLVKSGEISSSHKADILLNIKYSLDGASSEEIIKILTKYHGNDKIDKIISKFI